MEGSSDRRQRKVWRSRKARAVFPLLGNEKEMAVAPPVSPKSQMWQGSPRCEEAHKQVSGQIFTHYPWRASHPACGLPSCETTQLEASQQGRMREGEMKVTYHN